MFQVINFNTKIVDSLTNLYIAYSRFTFLAIYSLIPLVTLWEYNTHKSKHLKVTVDTLTMNISIRQNVGRGITFQILVSRLAQNRFRQNLAELLENDQSASGLFYIEWMAF